MANELSPQTEEYLASVVAGGLYSSKEAAIEAAVAALREKTEQLPFVPAEHMEQVEQAIASSDAGRSLPMTQAYWESLRQIVRDETSGNSTGT